MENENIFKKNTGKFLLGIFLIIVIAIGLYWYLGMKKEDTSIKTTEEAVEALSQTPESQIETNPVKKVPDINPVEKTKPFKTANPFE